MEIQLMGHIVTLIIMLKFLFDYRQKNTHLKKKRRFTKLVFANIAILILEANMLFVKSILSLKIFTILVYALAIYACFTAVYVVEKESGFRAKNNKLHIVSMVYMLGFFAITALHVMLKKFDNHGILLEFFKMKMMLIIPEAFFAVASMIIVCNAKKINYNLISVLVTLNLGLILDIVFPQVSLLVPMLTLVTVDIYIYRNHINVNKDVLTGLWNRRFLEVEAVKGHLARVAKVAVLFIDVDKFKSINDTYGHAVGDEVLLNVADILRTSVREGDNCIRFAGDEYIILAEGNKDYAVGDIIKDRIRKNLEFYNSDMKNSIKISLSIGTEEYSGSEIDKVVEHADYLMYEEKRRHHQGVT